jgi:hypothetical protein
MPPPAYSFSPQFATIRSSSPLEGMRPVQVAAPVIQHTPLAFARFEPFKIRSEQPELVTGGIASAITEGAGGALKGITAAYVGEREKKEGLLKEEREHTRAVELANIRSQKTPEELEYEKQYQDLRLQNLQSQIDERGGDKKPKLNIRPAGSFIPREQQPLEAVEVPLPGEPDFSQPPGALEGLSALQDMFPAVVTKPPTRFQVPVPEDFFRSQPPPAPLEDTRIVREQVPFSELRYEAIDEGSAEELQKQPPPAPLPPGTIPKTPQDMADFAAQQSAARLALLEEQMPKLDEMARFEADQMAQGLTQQPTSSQEVPTAVNLDDYVSDYESYQDALMANEALAKALPDFEVKDVVRQTTGDGQVYYSVLPPTKKAGAKEDEIPEGFTVKAAKLSNGKMTYTLIPKPEVLQEIEAIQQPMESIDGVLATIQQIRGIAGGISPGVGGMGSILKFLPSSDAWNVSSLLKNLEANIAFKTLAEMRAASPTGGALGAISERELTLLASSLGSIEQNLDYKYFIENLNRIEKGIIKAKDKINNRTQQILEKSQNFTPIQSQENRVEIKSQEDYNKLKSGQKYIFNGVTGTKK